DQNGDGWLTASEVQDALAVTGMGLSVTDRQKLLDMVPPGSPLAKQDFVVWLSQRDDLDLESDLRTIFALVDRDRSGTLDRAELSELLICLNPEITPEEIDATLDRIDLNRDGLISWEEFVSSQSGDQKLPLTLAAVRSFKKILVQYDRAGRIPDISLVEVDSDLGAGRRGAWEGIEFLKQAAMAKQASRQRSTNGILNIEQRGIENENDALEREQRFTHAKYIDAIYKVLHRSSDLVCDVLREDKFPVVLGGDHSTAAGTIAGIKKAFPNRRLGVIWIDAHADIHSPYTTPSGNMHGMPLAAATGHDNLDEAINQLDPQTRELWERCKALGVAGEANLRFDDLIYVAVRDTEAPEDATLARQGIPVVSTGSLRSSGPEAAAQQCLDYLSQVDLIYITFDVDSMDATICMGTGTPAPGGLWAGEAARLNAALVKDHRVCCWEICEINPLLDTLNSMAENSLHVFEAVLESIQSRPVSFSINGPSESTS
ncbi:MAG: arginase family protein, partial [Myxococcota bacterium]